MDNLTREQLFLQINDLQTKLFQQQKTTKALLAQVKKNLQYHLNINDTFEHNTYLLDQIKKTKTKLLTEAQATQKFSYLAKHDSLTGLYNREVFNQSLKSCIVSAHQGSQKHAVFFLDLDQFKIVNDTAGHLAGDEMLKQISSILLSVTTDKEVLARLGGDEFGFIMKNCNKSQALEKAQAFLSLIDEFHFSWDKKLFTVSVSIGLVIINKNTLNHVEAQKQADVACYAAKSLGRNRVHLYKANGDYAIQHNAELQWLPILTNALEKDLFCLYAQPITSSNSNHKYNHFEVLLRLSDKGKILLPTLFLPPAERYNLITKVDSWVIKNTFKWLEKNSRKFHKGTIFSINISGQSLGDKNILNLILELLEKRQDMNTRIQFEVTETMAISNLQSANNFIKKIKQHGCGFSLDDFGSGLSSLSYLKNLDVDTLKVDGVFIRDIIDDPIDEEMVNSINKIGHVMGMKTVAEYVENKEIADKLIDMGFDYLQGNYIGKPVPFEKLLENQGSRR